MLSEAELTDLLKEALRAHDAIKVSTLRLLKVALHNESIALGQPLTEAEQITIIRRELKRREEAISAYSNAGRTEQAATETAEAEILRSFLPATLSDEKVREIIQAIIKKQPADKPVQMGPVIGQAIREIGTQADGSTVSRITREQLDA